MKIETVVCIRSSVVEVEGEGARIGDLKAELVRHNEDVCAGLGLDVSAENIDDDVDLLFGEVVAITYDLRIPQPDKV